MSVPAPARVDALVRGYRREHLHRVLLTWACRLGSVFLAGLFIYLVMLALSGYLYLVLTHVPEVVH